MALLKLNKRDKLGTTAARALRAQGQIPVNVYGHGEANVAASVSRHDIELVVQHRERLVEIDVDGSADNCLIKDVQLDYLGQHIIHVDLTRVSLDERVEVTVPIVLRGTPAGVETEGGVLTQHMDEIQCQCLVTEIPEQLRIWVTELKVGDMLRASDLELPQGVVTTVGPDTPVASVTVLAEEEEVPAEEVEEAAEPEVIGEKPAEPEAGDEDKTPE